MMSFIKVLLVLSIIAHVGLSAETSGHNKICTSHMSGCDFYLNFRTSTIPNNGRGVNWYQSLSSHSCSCGCKGQGVLKLIPPASTSSLSVEMCLDQPYEYTFHIANAMTDGHCGGGPEMHNKADELKICRDYAGNYPPTLYVSRLHESVHSGPFSITIDKENATWGRHIGINNYHGVNHDLNEPLLFKWSTIYLGINRVVNLRGNGRVGSGLCALCIRWT